MAKITLKALKIFYFCILLMVASHLYHPYYYAIIPMDLASKIAEHFNGHAFPEETDDVYFYINFFITIFGTIIFYITTTELITFLWKKRRS